MAKKWNKLVARIQALEDAVAALLSGTGKKKTRRKAKKKKTVPGKAGRTTASRTKIAARAKGKSPARKSPKAAKKAPRRKSRLRVAVAEAAPILPQAPVALL